MTIPLAELLKSPCAWHKALAVGKLNGGMLQIDDTKFAQIEAECGQPGIRGLGDVVALVARPVARAIDAVAGTKLAGCGGCKSRQAKLNRILPL
jgi:hypothetical protein